MGRRNFWKNSVLFEAVLFIAAVLLHFTPAALADQITIDIPSVEVTVSKDADGYAIFSGEGIQYLSGTGEPAVPYQVVKALLPPGADLSTLEVSIERTAVASSMVEGEEWLVRPMPVPSTWDGEKVITLEDDDGFSYSESVRFPATLLTNVTSGAIWEWQLADIPVALFQYNPVTKRLYKTECRQAVLTFEHKSVFRDSKPSGFSRIGEGRVKKLAVNFDEISPEYPGSPVKRDSEKSSYVIITTRAVQSASAELDNFVKAKEARGFAVRVITEDVWGGGTGGTAADNIRNWLKNNYENLKIEYVLLIGNPHPDTGDVPMKMLFPRNNATRYPQYSDSPSDYYYADLTGNWDLDGDGVFGEWEDDFGNGGVDRNYEVVVGRIPYYGNMTDLDSILAKTVSYQNETAQDWRKNILLPMEPSDDITPGYHLGEAIKNGFVIPKGWRHHRVYEENYGLSPAPETIPCNADNVTAAWNGSQFGAVFWWTHGSSTSAADIMDISRAATLDNDHPVFTFQCSCTNAYPEATNNLTYSLLRNGAVAAVGATRVSWYWMGQTSFPGTASNSGMTYEYAGRLITEDMKSAGYALHDIKQTLSIGSDYLWMNFTDFCLYGDPEAAMISGTVADTPPSISDIPDQNSERDIELTVQFSVGDDKTPASDLIVSASSSDTDLVPTGNIIFGGSGENRTATIIPGKNKTGTATITFTVNDGTNTATEDFMLTVSELAGWQWQNPLPQGNALNDIWGSSENDIFAVGGAGTIFHYNGNDWTEMISGTLCNLNGVWGSSGNDVFAVGEQGVILHYNGNNWTPIETGLFSYFYDVWGSSKDNVFAVGNYGTILHYDGSNWTEMVSGISDELFGIWGTSENNVFAVGSGYGGTILHYDGNTWTKMTLPLNSEFYNLYAVWGTSENNVFAVGGDGNPDTGKVFHYDGDSWTEMAIGSSNILFGVWGTSENDVFAVGDHIFHYDGNIWTEEMTDSSDWLKAIWGTSKNNLFAVGYGSRILHYDGANWNVIMPTGLTNQFNGVWGSSDNDVFAVDAMGNIVHYDGNSWTEMVSGTSGVIIDIWGSSATDVFALGWPILHYDGNNWTEMNISISPTNLNTIWGSSGNDVFVGGSDTILHFDGSNWKEMVIPTSAQFTGIWGDSANDVFAVGYSCGGSECESVIIHYDGSTWTEMTRISSEILESVWGSDGKNVYAVGSSSTIVHYDGQNWTKSMMPGGVYTTIDDIWGSSSDDIFFVAGGGLIWHYNGIEFSSMQSNTSNHLTGIWGSSNSSVFAVGSDGTILHYSPPANSPVLSVTPAFQNISDETAGTTAFEVANAGTGAMKWEAEENTSWLSISPSSGTDSGSITVNYNANPSGESRIGTIRVTAAGATNSPKYIEVRQGSDYSGSDKLRNAIQALKVLAGMNITDIADDTDANGNGKTELEDAVRNLRDALK